jgi:L-threonylcarbamoyladenylate synthase
MPSHPVALELIRRAGVPVAAPSANTFGHTSPTTAEHVLADLAGRIDAVVDAGATEHGVESTVLDPCQSPMVIYRPGAVTSTKIRHIAGAVELFHDGGPLEFEPKHALPSPGVGLRHYAPKARLLLVEGPLDELSAKITDAASALAEERIGVMLPAEMRKPDGASVLFAWGRWSSPESLARELYAGLRKLDGEGCTVILCPLPPAGGLGSAIRDRLMKAATAW